MSSNINISHKLNTDFPLRFINRESGARGFIKKPASAVVQLDSSNFDSIALDSTKDVLVEFYAPCKFNLLICFKIQ